MALSAATITYDLSDYGLADLDSRRTKVWATNNVPGLVVDTEGNTIHLGSANGTINADGTGSITVPTPGTGSNPASWQTTIHVDYPDQHAPRGRDSLSFGPFTITVSANLADLVQQAETPPEIVGGDAWLATIDADGSSQYRQQQDARLSATLEAEGGKSLARNVAPAMELYEHLSDGNKQVLYQDGDTLYAVVRGVAGTVYKSTDRGLTWVTKGALAMAVRSLHRIEGTGTLIAVEATDGGTAGLNPKVKRSTDDGANWTQVHTIGFPPLDAASGIVSTPSGYVLIGEYGYGISTVYNLWRSTDDGLTFTAVLSSPGGDPVNDPGHFHSVVWDPYANKLIASMDRANHEHWVSSNEGATWSLIAAGTTVDHPNWVNPMFFPNHIAWGYDNQNVGRIGVISRTDYYAGNWDEAEPILVGNKKAMYGAFPVSEGVWMVASATEMIGADPDGIGSWAHETYLVDEEVVGSGKLRVTGGLSYLPITTSLWIQTSSGRVNFPAWPHDSAHQGGKSWMNLSVGSGISGAAVPYSVGTAPTSKRSQTGSVGGWVIPNEAGLWSRRVDGTLEKVLDYTTNDRVVLKNSKHANAPDIRLMETGEVFITQGGSVILRVMPDGTYAENGVVVLGSSKAGSPQFLKGTGTPEGVVTAIKGSVFVRTDGDVGTTLYVKEQFSGNTGWSPMTPDTLYSASSANLLSAAHAVNTSRKYAGREVWDFTLNKPLWATGNTATAAWRDATGAVVHTPA